MTVGCSNREKEAITNVIKMDFQMLSEASKGHETAGPQMKASWIKEYRENASTIDLTDCPKKFRTHYKRFSQRWDELQAALEKYPTIGESIAQGFLSGLTNTEFDLNLDEIKSDILDAEKNLQSAMLEMEDYLLERGIEPDILFGDAEGKLPASAR